MAMTAGETKEAMYNWVTANDESRFAHQAQGMCRMDVTHSNLTIRMHDIQFDLDMTLLEVKAKLYRHGGTGSESQELFLRRGNGDTVRMGDDSKTLRFYGAGNDMSIFIKDNDPFSLSKNGGLEDVSQVQKYEISEEAYEKRESTVRKFRREQAEQKKAELEAKLAAGEAAPERPATPDNVAELFPVGSRCEVNPGGRRGSIEYLGPVGKVQGTFLGIRLDEPQGMNDGTKDGHRYFDCPGEGYGCFMRPDPEQVLVGDYPELDPFASDDEF